MAEGRLHICPGPDVRTVTEDEQERFCFSCRAHTPHAGVVYSDSVPSYYEPNWAWECFACGNSTVFGEGWKGMKLDPQTTAKRSGAANQKAIS